MTNKPYQVEINCQKSTKIIYYETKILNNNRIS
jgi:hypothetical protein